MGWAKYEEDNREIIQDRWMSQRTYSYQIETYDWQHSGYYSNRRRYGSDTAYLPQADRSYSTRARRW